MHGLEPTWGRVMSVWWLLAWRSAVGFVLFVFAVGLVYGIIAALANLPRVLPISWDMSQLPSAQY